MACGRPRLDSTRRWTPPACAMPSRLRTARRSSPASPTTRSRPPWRIGKSVLRDGIRCDEIATRPPLKLRDHVLREHLQIADLVLQRLGVISLGVGDAEAHDDVGDALVLEPFDAVGGVGINRDDVDLE